MSAVPHPRLGSPVQARPKLGQRDRVAAVRRRRELKAKRSQFRPSYFAAVAAGLDAVTTLILALAMGRLWGGRMEPPAFGHLGLPIAALYVMATATGGGYGVAAYRHPQRAFCRSATVWCVICLGWIGISALIDTTPLPRAAIVCLGASGLCALLATRAALSWQVMRLARQGRIAARSLFAIGDEQAIQDLLEGANLVPMDLHLIGSAIVRSDHCQDDLTLAAARVRMTRPQDVLILGHWPERDMHKRCIDTFLRLPVDIHIDSHTQRGFVRLVRSSIDPLQAALKRGFDLLLGIVALIAFSPLLTLVAIMIRMDSKGPVFFRQTRYGYNQEPFRILKFRTMTTLENGAAVLQAKRNDARVTRVGRFLRRTSIDELPQLINVIMGDMSLVGPRPHAIAHDQAFERDVPLYGRRHNVKPGMTGWAQVHGLRGEIDTLDKIGQRVAHDLYYIDHWSLGLDLLVLARTVLSRRTYLNAH